jgi:glycosyltransferase involved in cell wall biosynthesis
VEGKAPLRILGETAYPLNIASGRVRVASFAPFLAEHGVELGFRATLTADEYRLLSSPASMARKGLVLAASSARAALHRVRNELLLVHRLRLMSPLPLIDPPMALDAYDFDDALFLGSAAPVNRRFQWAKQEAGRCLECLRRARLVIAGNAFLASEARHHAHRVEIVPSCVDPSRQPLARHEPVEVATIGWIGSQTTSVYVKPVLPVFERLNADRLRVRLVLVGADRAIDAPWIEHRRWSSETETSDLASFDVGIMPLPDTAWARGKCGYKILQYFSAGVPAVASPVGVTSELVGTERGVLAAGQQEWYSALEALIADADERRQRGAAARTYVEREFSYHRWAPELATMLSSLRR